MATEVVSQFEAALDRHDVRLIEATPDTFTEALDGVVERPAVGAPLPDPLDFAGTDVDPDPSVADIQASSTGVTPVSLGIAAYGSVVVGGSPAGEEPVSLFADHHVAVLAREDLVADMPAAIGEIGAAIRAGNGDNVIATGPSATADMGGLVLGAHGPKRVTVILVEGIEDAASGEADS